MDNGKTLYVRLATHLGDLTSGLAKGSAQISAFGAKTDAQMARLESYAKKNQKELKTLGNVAGGVGLVAAAGIGVALKKFADFDKQMSAVGAATHAGVNEMAALRAEAIRLGADTKFSAVEAAQGIEELAKAGVSTADILGGGLKGALDLAAAGELGVGAAAEIAATAMTQFNLKGDKIPHLADLLAAGAGKAQGSVTDLGGALNQAGLVASNMGLSIEDTTGSLAAFASAGLIGSDAGTAFKTMIQRLQAPMGRGAKALEKYGISAYDAQGNFVGITDVAGQLQSKLAGLSQEQRDAALAQIFGSDAIRAATVLYKQGATGMQKWIDKTNDAGYAAETARLRTDNLAGDIERLGGSLDSFFIGLGSGANGPMRELVQMLESVVDVAGAIPDPLMSAATAGLFLTAAFGGTVFAASRLIAAVGSTRASIALMRAQAAGAVTTLRAMDNAMMLKNAGKGVAGLAGIAIASGAAGDMFGYSNTAAFALMGAMGGPLGIAAGTATGFIMDVVSANNDLAQSFDKAAETASKSNTFQGQIDGLAKMKAAAKDMDFNVLSPSGMKEGIKFWTFQDSVFDSQKKKIAEVTEATRKYQYGIQALEDQTVGANDGVNEMFDPQRMQTFANEVGPVLEKIGLNIRDVLAEGPDGANWSVAKAAINEYRAETDTAAGRSKALGTAVAGLDDSLVGSADSASDLAKALQGLFSPALDYDAAVIKMKDSLAALREELGTGAQTFDLNTDAGRRNTEAVMGSVEALTGQLTAAANVGKSSEQIASMMDKGRDAIVRQGVAAGFSAEAMNGLLDKYELTPELVETLVKAKDQATPVISTTDKLLKALDGDSATVTIVTRKQTIIESFKMPTKEVDKPQSLQQMLNQGGQADGGFYPNGIPAAANGLYNDAHWARAGANKTIRYAEPETQGEAFIPFAMPKRQKATQILGKTAHKFGYDLSPRNGQNSSAGRTIVIQQAARGPLIGSLSIPAMPGQDARPVIRELTYELRRIERGGVYS